MRSSAQACVDTVQQHPNRFGLGLLLLAGVVPGLLLNPNPALPFPVSYISQVTGHPRACTASEPGEQSLTHRLH